MEDFMLKTMATIALSFIFLLFTACGDDGATVAAAQIIDHVIRPDFGHLQHLVDHIHRRGNPRCAARVRPQDGGD